MAKIAYLVNQYPHASHGFIRREILALEAIGEPVDRYTVRRSKGTLIEPMDLEEVSRTRCILDAGARGLLVAGLWALAARPGRLLRALALALRVGRRSQAGLLLHLVYLAEACVLARWLRDAGSTHLHAHFGTNSTTVAMLAHALGGPPYSFTVHGPEEFDRPESLRLGEKIRRARFVVAVSEFGRAQLRRWCAHAEWPKLRVVRCGLDGKFLDGVRPEPADTNRFVCVGRLAEQKGHLLLLEAFAALRRGGVSAELHLLGDGPMRPEIEASIRALGLESDVRMHGWVSEQAVREAMLGARALVVPSFAEGLPVVIMEAFALGRPVIATFVAGIPELVEGGRSGWLVPAGSVEALTQAMREAACAPLPSLARMAREGSDRVHQAHDALIEARKLAGLFAEPGRA